MSAFLKKCLIHIELNINDINVIKVVVAPKISLWKNKFFYDFKTGNYIISCVIYKERHSF